MLNIAFGQSKYYIDNLSENTKRGQRQKVRRGEYPGFAPTGYINDVRTKTIAVDRKKSKAIKQAFELYAENNSRLEDISHFLAENGVKSWNNNPIHKDRITFILSNPFYYGHFRYSGEVHEGKHQPIVSKKIFDKVQGVLKQRGKVRRNDENQPQPYCGLLRCGNCNMMITAEHKIKRQKNGNVHNYVYYRCSRKNKTIKCREPWIKQKDLDQQISSLLQKFSLRPDWATELRRMLEKDQIETAQSPAPFVQEARNRIGDISIKLQRLLDGYLDQDIDREIYREEKAKLLSEKKTLEEKIINLEQKQIGWIAPMSEWIEKAENLGKIAQDSNLYLKKVAAKEIFGLHLLLANREVELSSTERSENSDFTPTTQWASLSDTHCMTSDFSESQIAVPRAGFEPA